MPTPHYEKMSQDLAIAKKIAYGVPANVCNTTLQELKVKSLILLSHAIIEEYLEDLVLDTATKCVMNYVTSSNICRGLVGLISSGLIGRIEESGLQKKTKKEPFENIGIFSNFAYGRFKTVVGDNNGIKVKDQMNLLLPVGVDPSTEDPATMAALDSFGTKRGTVDHAFKITKAHTLSEIDGDIQNLLQGLVNYDQACLDSLQ